MPVTALYIELLISGLLVSIWLLILCLRTGILHPEHLAIVASSLQAYSSPTSIAVLSIPVLGILYLLGAYMNTASYRPFEFLIGNRLKKKFILSTAASNQHMIAVVYTECSGEVVRYIETQLMFMRMYRASFFNFLFIGIQCILSYPANWKVGVIGVILVFASGGCVFLFKEVAVLYYRCIREAFDLYKNNGPMRSTKCASSSPASEPCPPAPLGSSLTSSHAKPMQPEDRVIAANKPQKKKGRR